MSYFLLPNIMFRDFIALQWLKENWQILQNSFATFSVGNIADFPALNYKLKQLWNQKKMNKKTINQQYLQTLERRCFALCRHFAINSFRWFNESSPSFIKIIVFSRLHSWQHFDSGVYADALPTIDQCNSYLILSALSCQI